MMEKKTEHRNHLTAMVCVVLLVLVTGIGCFFLGKQYEAIQNRKEQDLNVLLNRSDLEGLGEIDGTIYVTGHKSPDTDTVCSSIAYAALLQKMGYDAVPVVLGRINKETEYVLKAAGVETPALLDNASGLNFVLVDHGDYAQSADGMDQANIISIIDHHGEGSVETGNQLIYDARPLGSTATIIWIRYRNYGIELDKQTAFLMVGAILSDTKNFESKTTTTADREAVKALCDLAEISDKDALYSEMYKQAISYEGMTDEEIFYSDYKEYETNGKKYSISCINVYGEDDAKDMTERMKKYVQANLSVKGMDMAYVQIYILHDGISMNYILPSDDTAAEVLRSAFPDAVFDGTSFILSPGISRKQVLVPAITDVLEG
ncbi:MAG: DHH family phosphoesterase [Clostridiales bacterium]|nr:DHH family phosphoesterase [Clostridiales bacterium]